MPNVRKKGKKLVSIWLSEEERDALKDISKKTKTSMTEILRTRIDEHLKNQKK